MRKVIFEYENIRIVNHDCYNCIFEVKEPVLNPETNVYSYLWQFRGYFRSILGALSFILIENIELSKNALEGLQIALNDVLKNRRNFLLS